MSTAIGSIKHLFSAVAREQCLENLKKIAVPRYGKTPTKCASVLVPVCKVGDVPSLLYTIRATNLRSGCGEVAFPGGRGDKSEDPVQTALRQTFEEIGLSSKKIEIWGRGPAVPSRNNTLLIIPVIGSVSDLKQEDLKVNMKEVLEVFTIPIEMLCDPKNQYYTQFSNGFILPVFVVDDYKIWGITAYLTHAFLWSALSRDLYTNEWMKKKIVVDKLKSNTEDSMLK